MPPHQAGPVDKPCVRAWDSQVVRQAKAPVGAEHQACPRSAMAHLGRHRRARRVLCAGVFRVTRDSSVTQVLTAVFALLGGLFAAILTFIGVLVKNSLDTRTLQLAQETEDRLTLETLFKGVDLVTGPDGHLAPAIQ